ncbi:unnamed protein product [Blepharisma stoltei]|uniref:Uncharacterized protein n=1 Tax=Blepharisma stoltei TaxID=1481888 RepID=A0AAU9IHR4_9CILI|nr:unnamed protein product [Blepharisma stoltei]
MLRHFTPSRSIFFASEEMVRELERDFPAELQISFIAYRDCSPSVDQKFCPGLHISIFAKSQLENSSILNFL